VGVVTLSVSQISKGRPTPGSSSFFVTVRQSLITTLCIVVCSLFFVSMVAAQVTNPPNINGGNAIGAGNIGGTTTNTQNFGSLAGLGNNQGATFTFTGQPLGAALWNGGFNFINNDTLQFQADNSALDAGNPVNYEFTFTRDVYGLQFFMSGLDFGDETLITFWRNNVQVPIAASTYNNGAETVAAPGNILTFVGTNIDIAPSGGGFIADGDGNNDTGGIGIHGAQEGFSIALPLTTAVDEVRLTNTGKNNGATGNVTLILTNFAWATPDVALTKASSFSQGGNGESNSGDIITYNYVIENTGNVPLSNISLTETGFTGTGGIPTLSFVSGTAGGTATDLPLGATATFTASYSVTGTDLLAGFVDNQGTVIAMPDDSVTDVSDSSNPGDGGTTGSPNEDDPTTTTFPNPIVLNPSIVAEKVPNNTGIANPATVGNTISYSITIENNGDLILTGVSLTDTLTNDDGTLLGPATPTFVSSTSSSPQGTLIVGESATYSLSYLITQADIDSGGLSNTITANATAENGANIQDVSDDGDDGDGNTVDDPAVTTLPANPSIIITKIAIPDSNVPAGTTVTYTYRVTNNGNQTITNIDLSDSHGGTDSLPDPDSETVVPADDIAPTGDSSDITANDGIWSSLAPGDTVTFTADYIVTQEDIDTLQ